MPTTPTQAQLLEAVAGQADRVVELVDSTPGDLFTAPTRASGWDVATLATHLARVHSSVLVTLDADVDGPPALTAPAYFPRARAYAADVSRLAVEQAAGRSPARVRQDVRDACTAAVTALQEGSPDRAVRTRGGVMTLQHFTWTRVVEQVVHTLDLAAALGRPAKAALHPSALTLTARLVGEQLAAAEPGHAVEVRVPPRTAVQLGEGSRHTRGTPPNTVETDEVTLVELASRRVAWADAVTDGRLRTKGDRSNLARLFPTL